MHDSDSLGGLNGQSEDPGRVGREFRKRSRFALLSALEYVVMKLLEVIVPLDTFWQSH